MKKSIKRKVMTVFIGMMVIVLFVSTAILYITINYSERNRVLNEIDEIMDEKLHSFNHIISTINNCGNYLRYDAELNEVFNAVPQNEHEKNSALKKISSDIAEIYEMNLGSNMYSYGAAFFANEKLPCTELMLSGAVYKPDVSNSEFRLYTTSGIDNSEWFLKTIEKKGLVHTFLSEDGTRLYVSQMIMNENYIGMPEKYLGAAVVCIELYEVLSEIERIGGYDAAAAIIYGEDVVLKTAGVSDNAFSGDAGYIKKEVETDIGLKLVSVIPGNRIGMKKQDLINIFSIYIVTAFVLTLILSSIISKSLTRPITNLSHLMKDVKKTNIENLHIKKLSDDEVGELYDSFNYMTDTISELIEKIKEETSKRYEVEFKLYQNRINPHMLYNTLDSISWLAILEGNQKIVEMNKLLSEIYRYSIAYSDSMANLFEELECVKKYIRIQQLRSDDPLILKIEDGDYDKVRVPQFILQPLVENSVIHGYEAGKNELTIKIKLITDDKYAKIIIEDNGKGCDINEVNENLKKPMGQKKIGMRNVNTRIKLKFGDEYGLYAENVESGGTRIIILLPAPDEEEIQ